jgi:hypothetical protein
MNTNYNLHIDLQRWVIKDDKNNISSIKHPEFELYDVSKYSSDEINELYLKQKELLENYITLGRFKDYIMSIPVRSRVWKFHYFTNIKSNQNRKDYWNINDIEYWKFLRILWLDNSKNISQLSHIWYELLRSKRLEREFFMNQDERTFFQNLPNQFVVYRGYMGRKYISDLDNPFSKCFGPDEIIDGMGYSYTLSKEIGLKYYKKYEKYNSIKSDYQNCLFEGIISKEEVLGYINEKNEEEIIIIPRIGCNYGT